MDNEGLSGFTADQGVQPSGRRSEYLVVARRYRPQAFAELVGQEHVARALSAAISTNRVGHAYLFTGARGVGKTSAARILAKCLNCEQGPTPVPCDRCDSCLAVASGDDVDVLEIDGASNRGIEEMRELRHNVAIRPSRSRFKIYIIDEVHMLTREAFNALLKTLEEPPEHVKFIFCTTEVEKIPVTILSRCQRFDFAGIQPGSIVGRLRQIVDAEQIAADDAALALLSRRANGSMRDSQSLLEQLLASGGKRITVDEVNQLLGTASDERLTQLAGHLVSRDAASALADFDGAIASGVDPGQLLDQLLVYLRDLMVAAVGGSSELFLQSDAGVHATLSEHAQQLGVQTILAMMQVLDQAIARLRYSTQGRVLAELALVRISQLADLDEIPALIEQLRGPEGAAVVSRAVPAVAPRPNTMSAERAPAADRPSGGTEPSSPGPSKKNGDSEGPESALVPASRLDAAIPLNPADAPHIWQQTLARLQGIAADYATQADHVAISAPNLLVVTFAKKYNSSKAFCEQPEQAQKIEQALAEVTGRNMRINYLLAPESASETAAVVRPVAA
ncbi:MAG TPA: DNA polymerase III subunit gamma/tau, partial [Pirellulales bacterium]